MLPSVSGSRYVVPSGVQIGESVTPLSMFCIAIPERGHRQVDSLAGAVRPR